MMMKLTLGMVCTALLAMGCTNQTVTAQTEKTGETPQLTIGDAAPAWAVSKWLNGAEVKAAEPGKVYVVEFWATWCGPCIKAMPHLAELQAAHKDEGLVVIGMTTKDDTNTLEAVTKFVETRGPKLGYVFAFCDNEATDKAYMQASGQDGIPCSFVIDRKGKIAYIGHPMNLDDVLPKVLAGTWKGKEDADLLALQTEELENAFTKHEEAGDILKALMAFGKKYPAKYKSPDIQSKVMVLLINTKQFDEAAKIANEMIAVSREKKSADPAVYVLSFLSKELNPEGKHLDLVDSALAVALEHEKADIQLWLAATDYYARVGKTEQAKAAGDEAVKNAPNDAAKEQVKKIVADLMKAGK
jgi:thiol-disulfide isomerase/thioredoxin